MTLQEILFIVSIVFFVLAVVCIGLAVAIFFVRNIPDVRADLSGKKRADAVAQIAAQRPGRDRRKGVARVEPTSGNLDSGRLREPSPLDNHLNQVPHVNSVVTTPEPASAPAVSASPVNLGAQAPASAERSEARSSLPAASSSDSAATTVLPDDDSATTILPDDDSSTTILEDDASATTILPSDGSAVVAPEAQVAEPSSQPESAASGAAAPEGFTVVKKIVLRESSQVIQASSS